MDISTAGHLDGLDQLTTSGLYRVARKFTAVCYGSDHVGLHVLVFDNDHQFLGVAAQHRFNGITGNWWWVSATGDGTSSEHTRGPRVHLSMVDGHLLPPIDAPKWSREAAIPAAGMTSMMVTESERAAIMAFRSGVSDAVQD